MSAESRPSTDSRHEPTPLRAILEVELPESIQCPVARETPNASAVTQTITGGGDGGGQTCQNEVTVADGTTTQTEYVSTSVDESCACAAIRQFECVFDLEGVRDGALRVSLVVPERSLLGDVVSALRETGASVDLRRISRLGDDGGSVELDATAITEKQREAVELAVELGYYDRPRGTDLAELADRLDVSRSAVSQRLNAVESTLVQSLVADRDVQT